MYSIKIKNSVDEVKNYPTYDEEGNELTPIEMKTPEEIAAEEQALKDEKTAEIQAKVDAYEAAKEHQKQNGGPGPVADFEVMKICNEYNCEFEVIFKEEE